MREVVFDIETTGLSVSDGNRIISVGMVELIDGKRTGNDLEITVNPGRDSEPGALAVHKMTAEFLSQFQPFAAHAETIRDFIDNDPLIITCRTENRDENPAYTLDIEFLRMELQKTGIRPVPDTQWINVRRWSEELFGQVGARLDNVFNHYKDQLPATDLKLKEVRAAAGHGALLDAQILAAVYPLLKTDYTAALSNKMKTPITPPQSTP